MPGTHEILRSARSLFRWAPLWVATAGLASAPVLASPLFLGQEFDAGHAASVAVGDFNGDGRQDLVTANHNSGDVSVLIHRERDPIVGLQTLINEVDSLDLSVGIDRSLLAKLMAALRMLEHSNERNEAAVVGSLQAFAHEIEIQRGKRITHADADAFATRARDVIDSMRCK